MAADPHQPVDILRSSLAALIAESQALRTDVHAAESARRRQFLVNTGVLGMLALFVLLVLVVAWQNNQVVTRVNQTNARVADCTNPGGKCYEDGKRRTGDAIGDIIRAEAYMAECARLYPGESGPAFDQKLEACVNARLAATQHARAKPTPTPTPTH